MFGVTNTKESLPRPADPDLLGTWDQFRGRQVSMDCSGVGAGSGFSMIQVHCIYCALYFSYYYTVVYNEINIQLTIIRIQWEP